MSGEIFVGGEHRSGTTLVATILNAHPSLTVGPELDFLEPVNLGPYIVECCELVTSNDARAAGAGVLTADPDVQLGVQFVKQCHRFGVETRELADLVKGTIRLLGTEIESFGERCLLIDRIGRYRCRHDPGQRWGIKIQRNIARADDFTMSWREARFVHVVRDGRDVAASHVRGGRWWGYRDVEEAASRWLEVVDGVARAGKATIHTVCYERLVVEPRSELVRLLQFLEVPWSDRVLEHTTTRHSLLENPHEHPSAEEVSQPIYAHAVGRYKRDLEPSEIAAFEEIAAPGLARLGYALDRLPG